MTSPAVSVVIPAYRSERTMAGCLQAVGAQSFEGFETVVVDSSPDAAVERIVRGSFPDVIYEHSDRRLLPHAARNRGVDLAHGDLLVFTDPDVYPQERWLETLVGSHRKTHRITVGAIACHGRRWVDVGNHLCKFSTWLPGGRPRVVDNAPTANLLCPRDLFVGIGRFPSDQMLGDTAFSWRARALGHELRFEPRAVVVHDHGQSVREMLHERRCRGELFGELRAERYGNRRSLHLAYLLVSLLPIRLVRIVALTTARCWRAGLLPDLAWTLPVVVLGHVASLAGECRTYAARLAAPPARGRT